MTKCYNCGKKITTKNLGRIDIGFYSDYITCKKCAIKAELRIGEVLDLRTNPYTKIV